MNSIRRIILIALAVLASTASVHGQSPREQLGQMVDQLQKSPGDNALREKIIKLAKTVKPAPAVPEEAQRREGRAKFAFKNAKSNEDYLGAAREYEEATRVAPWVPGYYSDLCTIYEKAEKYVEAKRNCEFSLAGLTDPSQVDETKQRIAGLEYGIEKASSPQARQAALLAKVNGARFVRNFRREDFGIRNPVDFSEIYEIEGNTLRFTLEIRDLAGLVAFRDFRTPGVHTIGRLTYADEKFTLSNPDGSIEVITIEPDGKAILNRKIRNANIFSSDVPLPSPARITRQ